MKRFAAPNDTLLVRFVLLLSFALIASGAHAQSSNSQCSRARQRAAPVVSGATGLLVGGTGHFTACQPRTARRLLAAEGIGLGGVVLGGGGLVATGASRRTVAPFAAIAILGFGTYAIGWLSDLYGSINQGRSVGSATRTAPFEFGIGYRYIHDPQFDYRNVLRLDGEGWFNNTRVFGHAWLALDDDNQRYTVGLGQRFVGSDRGSSLAAETAMHVHRFGSDNFQSIAFDLMLRGRLDLAVIGPTLAGSFVEADIGLGVQGFGYQATGGGVSEDWSGTLLARVGYGFFLGPSGEVLVYYDHRRDDFAGGLSLDSVAAGALGHIGVAGRGFFGDGQWGMSAELEYGASVIVGVSLLYRAARRER